MKAWSNSIKRAIRIEWYHYFVSDSNIGIKIYGGNMRIAFSADLHLTSKSKHPERFNALGYLLKACLEQEVEHLVLAGDTFNEDAQTLGDFEALVNNKIYKNIQIHIIPGNHDPGLEQKSIQSTNVKIYAEPQLTAFDEDWHILFIPYARQKTMGEVIQPFADNLPEKWVLVGHGDWSQSVRQANLLEPGIYMPLTRKDTTQFQPDWTVLGHIHIPYQDGRLYYPGSPCGLDITETGRRRFLILDTHIGSLASQPLESDVIFFNERIVVFPTDNEQDIVKERIQELIQSWDLNPKEKARVRLRIKCQGYSGNREALATTVKEAFRGFQFYDDPDYSQVKIAQDYERESILLAFREALQALEWESGTDEPSKDDIILQALELIYSGS